MTPTRAAPPPAAADARLHLAADQLVHLVGLLEAVATDPDASPAQRRHAERASVAALETLTATQRARLEVASA